MRSRYGFKLLLAQAKTPDLINIDSQPVLDSSFWLPCMNGDQFLIFKSIYSVFLGLFFSLACFFLLLNGQRKAK